jgi:putative ABC transport system permease protein
MRRRRETAIRIALGATRRQVLREVVGSALKLVLAGIAIGILAALLAGRLLSNQLYGIRANDPMMTAVVSLFLLLIAFVASCVPAFRAAHTDAVGALKD